MSSRISNEQPMSKRQRIEAAADASKRNGTTHNTFDAISPNSNKSNHTIENSKPPDILPIGHSHSHSHSHNKLTINPTIITNIEDSTTERTNDEIDNSVAGSLHCDFSESTRPSIPADIRIVEFPDLLKSTSNVPMTIRSNEHVPGVQTPIAGTSSQNNGFRQTNSLISFSNSNNNSNNSTNPTETIIRFSNRDSNNYPSSSSNPIEMTRPNKIDINPFQLNMMKECLCGIDERSLRHTFAAHCYKDTINGTKHPLPLDQWPSHKLIQFLSNMEYLFEIYLNQNAKGEICTRIMQVCDLLLTNDRNNIIDDIFLLADNENQFVQYLAIKVLANCILIAKDKEEYCQSLLTTLMSNLNVKPSETTQFALRKISFVLGVILHIMEWKDIKKNPRDDQIVINGREIYNDSDNENFTLPLEMPTIETNYFAVQHAHDDAMTTTTNVSSINPSSIRNQSADHPFIDQIDSNNLANFVNDANEEEDRRQQSHLNDITNANSCHLQYLSDSESFDSKDLKYSITDLLGHKWPLLVEKMANCITLLQINRDLNYIENTIITFLTLWERIINVDTCISYDSTLPFHEKLTRFEEILIRGRLPIPIYKQILTLFSASLCYTTTLALQSEVPQETNALATEIFNSVKSTRIFSSLPTSDTKIQNDIGFIGFRYTTVVYGTSTVPSNSNNHTIAINENRLPMADTATAAAAAAAVSAAAIDNDSPFSMEKSIDFILLQKLVLLILKAIVVTVRPIRSGDSSDSSMDSCSSTSSNADQEQDNILVERATRDVFSKLKKFLKNKLNQHPDTHLTKVIVHLFSNQDEYLIEAMLCMLGTTITFLPRQMPFAALNRTSVAATNQPDRNQFIELIKMISPVYTFLEFLEIIKFDKRIMLELLISDDTCFLLYFLRFLKYIRSDWAMFRERCNDWLSSSNTMRFTIRTNSEPVLQRVMDVLIRLRLKLERLVLRRVFPYDISPLLSIMHQCERLHEGNEHELF